MAPLDPGLVRAACAAEGLRHLATLAPPPAALDPRRHDLLAADGVGDMGWLLASRALRERPTALLPTARAIVCVALHYDPPRPSGGLRRAAYAAGRDYHGLLRAKLARVGRRLDAHGGPWRHRACADSAPLDERTLAQLAGLGWIGRNALLISPRHGSYRLLGFLLTEAPLPPLPGGLAADRCGACTRCEARCPTGALVERRCLSERCISYLTIEHRGVIPRALAERFEGWWFGCDLCQEVCPWNRFAPPAEDARLSGGGDDEEALLALTEQDFDRHFAGRAIRRLGWARFRRNLVAALFSLGRADEARRLAAAGPDLARAQAAELGL